MTNVDLCLAKITTSNVLVLMVRTVEKIRERTLLLAFKQKIKGNPPEL